MKIPVYIIKKWWSKYRKLFLVSFLIILISFLALTYHQFTSSWVDEELAGWKWHQEDIYKKRGYQPHFSFRIDEGDGLPPPSLGVSSTVGSMGGGFVYRNVSIPLGFRIYSKFGGRTILEFDWRGDFSFGEERNIFDWIILCGETKPDHEIFDSSTFFIKENFARKQEWTHRKYDITDAIKQCDSNKITFVWNVNDAWEQQTVSGNLDNVRIYGTFDNLTNKI